MAKYKKGISVIVPVFKQGHYLQRCVDSLFAQTFKKNIEYIFVIDKNANSGAEDIISKTASCDLDIKIIKPKNGNRQGFNRNVGIEHITKEFFGFSDDDDYSDSDFFERLYDYANIYNADIMMGETTVLLETTNSVISKVSYPLKIEYTVAKAMNFIPWCTVWDKIFRTKTFIDNKNVRFQEGLCDFDDNVFILNALYYSNKVVATSGSSYYWLRHDESVQVSPEYQKQRIQDSFTAMNKVLDYINEIKIPTEDKVFLCKKYDALIASVLVDNNQIEYIQNRIKEITTVK